MYLKQKRLISGQRLTDYSACYGLSVTAFSGYGTVSDSSISLKRYTYLQDLRDRAWWWTKERLSFRLRKVRSSRTCVLRTAIQGGHIGLEAWECSQNGPCGWYQAYLSIWGVTSDQKHSFPHFLDTLLFPQFSSVNLLLNGLLHKMLDMSLCTAQRRENKHHIPQVCCFYD